MNAFMPGTNQMHPLRISPWHRSRGTMTHSVSSCGPWWQEDKICPFFALSSPLPRKPWNIPKLLSSHEGYANHLRTGSHFLLLFMTAQRFSQKAKELD
jgi:hypothetical protein